MEHELSGQPNVVVRLVGRTGIVSPKVQVFVDGRPVGVLSDGSARSMTLGAGLHRVVTWVGFVRSGTQFLSLATGERAALECGFRRWPRALQLVFIGVSGLALALIRLDQFRTAMATHGIALAVIVADLLMTFTVPGARLYLRRGAAPPTAEDMPDRLDPPSPAAGPAIGRRGFQFHLRALLILVACCAPLFWLAREAWDRRSGNRPDRAFRMLRSANESERLSGVRALQLLVTLKSLTPGQVDAAITELLVALRDRNPEAREAASYTLFSIVLEATQRSAAVPQVQAIARGLMEGVCDLEPAVRCHATLALSSIYFLSPLRGFPPPPLPQDTGRFAGLLAAAAMDQNFVVRSSAIFVLHATAPRLGGAPRRR